MQHLILMNHTTIKIIQRNNNNSNKNKNISESIPKLVFSFHLR